MARNARYAPLGVFLNGRRIGALRREPSGAIDFTYDSNWLAWEHAIPVSLSLPLREDRYIGAAVLAVFENLLPDNEPVRRLVAAKVRAKGTDAYSLLSVIGRDCVGALQFLPGDEEPGAAGMVEGSPMSDAQIGALIDDLASTPLGLTEDDTFRISIAGAQEKTALLFHDGQWWSPTGTTATTHILKPQIGRLPNGIDLSQSVENEYLCMKLTAALGLPTANVEIADFDGRRVLVVERFDRTWARDGRLLRLPQEDMCQALSTPPSIKYESDGGPGIVPIAKLLSGSDDPSADQRNFIRANLVYWLLGATDGHAKNFSVFLGPGARYRMTPLYDVMSAQPNVDAGQVRHNQFRLSMAVGDRRHYAVDSVMSRHFVQTAGRAGIGERVVSSIIEELSDIAPGIVNDTIAQMPAGIPNALTASIKHGIARRIRHFYGAN